MATLLYGKEAATSYKQQIKQAVDSAQSEGLGKPHLAAIMVGEDPASAAYVRGKVKDCDQVGFDSTLIRLPDNVPESDLLAAIHGLNNDDAIDGFIVQLPLPDHIDDKAVLMAIDPKKDVDGFHPENIGRMALGLSTYLPATPYGIQLLLKYYQIDPSGQRVLVIGRSQIVGSPMSILLSRNQEMGNATVTLAHSRTIDIKGIAQQSDIIIAALGKPGFVTADMVKKGAIVIDVGINRVDGKLVGDVDFKQVEFVASAITPVPGGVGLMTRVGLLMNTLQAAYGH
ncbi:MAG: bifunctional 5,10-methylenetetrahydrofolate dehydrogenase/5,10-methenyltetrahydrofolate cyclohydrolase [Flavobacteriales bacterium]|jgi:methylenetetrahydrofolate dehydrogenase (NADP+)/methenyltetrahydrofolate cyclohydrolase|nr:bifunctional 5,10-methylenetetrahydrofolate dehydrogenase/5,10-methenyltetrahydrofolate cyclohydrolase [Flavobacteriales bacterium]MBT3572381.1 bifunctional 5,10-methylenetetrahydrofolate dehydrogenase/5,10-methenyltetrahydrofolate cyclohydrolase [Flavobacteriales bacterium]MBT3739136.1 bifunctional 5,10-methylenetetrahydrofolate dehydrogenase/5,10-methenyltetrahydrofolate cyclohydrolase [Flavobacteriales bacterium]MBT4103151.1 bifunctional 5,10-methylenetetrahydrofolate dehydrogenase/5,10-me